MKIWVIFSYFEIIGNVQPSIQHPEDQLDEDEIDNKNYRLYGYRWIICLFFSTQQMAFGMCNVGYSPIFPFMSKVYTININYVTSLGIMYAPAFIIVNFFSNRIASKHGMATPIFIASLLGTSGAFLRLLVPYGFEYMFIGQLINAIGMPFVQAHGATVAQWWFGDNERSLVTALTSVAIPVGSIIGLLLPNFFVSDKEEDFVKAKEDIWTLTLVQSIIFACMSIPNFLVARDKPVTPPSASAEKSLYHKNEDTLIEREDEVQKTNFRQEFYQVFWSSNFWRLNISQMFTHSIFAVLGSSVSVIVTPFGYDAAQISYIGGAFVLTGLIAAIIHGIILDKYQKFKLHLLFISISSIVFTAIMAAVVKKNNILLTLLSAIGLGASTIPIIGVSFEFWGQITYPANENIGCGLIVLSMWFLGTLEPYLIIYLIDNYSRWWPFGIFGIGLFISLTFSFTVDEDLRKNKIIHANAESS